MTAQTLNEMRALLQRHGLKPRTSLGQHFLADPNLTRRIVTTAGITRGDRILEVGAGTGTLTRQLVTAGAEVIAIEVDEQLKPVLEETMQGLAVKILFVDAATVDYQRILDGGPWKVVANLPYHIGTQLVLDWLRLVPAITEMTVMVQLEVAQRMSAAPGSRSYGLPSVVARLHADLRVAFRVPPQVFYPPPKVESAVVRIVRKDAPPEAARAIELAAAGFGQRRKMLRGSLAMILPAAEQTLLAAGIDPTKRAEDLSPADYLRLAEAAA